MPTIKTIKPDGTGDYTTLAAWEDFADGQVSGDQWAECYSGDCGPVYLDVGWAESNFSDSIYAKIYAAPGHRHDGNPATTCAKVVGSTSFPYGIHSEIPIIVDGMRVDINSASVVLGVDVFANYDGATLPYHVKNNLVVCSVSAVRMITVQGSVDGDYVIENNIVTVNGNSSDTCVYAYIGLL